MTNHLSRFVPGIFGVFFISFAVIEISQGEYYSQRGGRIVVAARSPISFWIMICVEFAAGIFLIGMTWYGLRHTDKK